MPFKVMMVFGTRPETIKMAPLARVLRHWPGIELSICSTGQHREMLKQVLDSFELKVDLDLQVMTQDQTLNGLSQQLLSQLDTCYERLQPDIVLVHGDTTTSFVAALAAFNRQLPIGHVEAGLRTGNLRTPWPEEANRRLTGVLADLHFAPTANSQANLLRENVPAENIEVTGNTVIDALLWMRTQQQNHWRPAADSPLAVLDDTRRMVLITGHRRENFGEGVRHICEALAILARRYADVQFVYPVHLNPQVRNTVYGLLSDQPNLYLVAPQDYSHFVWLMGRSYLILSDSGGVQEEAPAIGKPLLEGGTVRLVGTNRERIVHHVCELLDDAQLHARMSRVHSPYGDGHASERIARRLDNWLKAQARPYSSYALPAQPDKAPLKQVNRA